MQGSWTQHVSLIVLFWSKCYGSASCKDHWKARRLSARIHPDPFILYLQRVSGPDSISAKALWQMASWLVVWSPAKNEDEAQWAQVRKEPILGGRVRCQRQSCSVTLWLAAQLFLVWFSFLRADVLGLGRTRMHLVLVRFWSFMSVRGDLAMERIVNICYWMSLWVSVCFTYLLFDIIIFVFDLFILHYTCISLYFFVNIACPSLVHAIHLIDLLHNTHVVNA